MINKIIYYSWLFFYVVFSLFISKGLFKRDDQQKIIPITLNFILIVIIVSFGASFFLMSLIRAFLPLSENEDFNTEVAIAISSGIINFLYNITRINHLNKEEEKMQYNRSYNDKEEDDD